MQVLITVPRVKFYENDGISFLCKWTKTEVFEYDDAIHRTANAS